MKKVEAIIRRHKLDAVKEALSHIGVEGMTVTEVCGRGHKHGVTLTYRGATMERAFVPNVKIEIVVADNEVDSVVDAIFQNAHTGEVGDGRITVSNIECVVRIRTGEVDAMDTQFIEHRSDSNAYARM